MLAISWIWCLVWGKGWEIWIQELGESWELELSPKNWSNSNLFGSLKICGGDGWVEPDRPSEAVTMSRKLFHRRLELNNCLFQNRDLQGFCLKYFELTLKFED